jgi:hypothetical protein
MLHRDAAELLLQLLVDDGLVTAFVSALQARGVAIDADALADPDGEIPFEELEAFLPRARAFRCRVLKNGQVAGSGVLVGPSLVLTSCRRPPRPERAVGVRLSSGGADFDGSSERAVPR